MEEWKLDHPELSQGQISDIHATAERMKDQMADPPSPEPRVAVPVTKLTRALDRASLHINETVTAAAAIVAAANEGNATKVDYSKYILPPEIVAKITSFDGDSNLIKRSPPGTGSSWWMETIRHDGKVPFGGSANDGYKVFRNVKKYGAVVLTPLFVVYLSLQRRY